MKLLPRRDAKSNRTSHAKQGEPNKELATDRHRFSQIDQQASNGVPQVRIRLDLADFGRQTDFPHNSC